jgi:hypothetical protein
MKHPFAFALILSVAGLEAGVNGARADVPLAPPDGYPYANRTVDTPARSHVNDPNLTDSEGDFVATINVSASRDGNAIAMWTEDYGSSSGAIKYLDYYFNNQGSDDYVEFDIRDQRGHFSGYSSLWSWTAQGGDVNYMLAMAVNGEDHSVHVLTDAAGNIKTEEEVRYTPGKNGRQDRCRIISDWGARQCPAHFDSPKKIPTKVMMAIGRVWSLGGFFKAAIDTVKNVVSAVGKALADPTVQKVLANIVIIGGAVGCCVGSSGSICAGCVMAGFKEFVELNTSSPTPDPNITSDSAALRASGSIRCAEGTACFPVIYGPPPIIN